VEEELILYFFIFLNRRSRKERAACAVAEGLGVRALLRRFGSRAPIHTGRGLATGPARKSGGAPPHSKALRAPEAPQNIVENMCDLCRNYHLHRRLCLRGFSTIEE
jgi:hypothetical protein